MQVRAEFQKREVVFANEYTYVPSPLPGVSRMMLDRMGDEVARATSIVKYAAGAGYSGHTHGGGEEILVLQGLFRDEYGEYPAGSWLRNPRWSKHTPYTGAEGALIYVKVGHLGANFLPLPAYQPKVEFQFP